MPAEFRPSRPILPPGGGQSPDRLPASPQGIPLVDPRGLGASVPPPASEKPTPLVNPHFGDATATPLTPSPDVPAPAEAAADGPIQPPRKRQAAKKTPEESSETTDQPQTRPTSDEGFATQAITPSEPPTADEDLPQRPLAQSKGREAFEAVVGHLPETFRPELIFDKDAFRQRRVFELLRQTEPKLTNSQIAEALGISDISVARYTGIITSSLLTKYPDLAQYIPKGTNIKARPGPESVAGQLRDMHKQSELTLGQVAGELGITAPNLGRIFNGRAGVSHSQILKLSRIYGADPEVVEALLEQARTEREEDSPQS